MNARVSSENDTTEVSSRLVLALFVAAGMILILVSLIVPPEGPLGYVHEATKELGIVVLSVFTVSFLYEITLARRYLTQFLSLLGRQVEKGDSNAATCALLGIDRIFPSRAEYELHQPLADVVAHLVPGSYLFITARSLFLVMTKAELIKRAIERGADVNLCILDPRMTTAELDRSPDVELSDISSTVSIFSKQIVPWVEQNRPRGRLVLTLHRIPLLDSCLQVVSPTLQLLVWDLSFGRDLTSKRVLIIDPRKQLAADLSGRYHHVRERSTTVFSYDGIQVATNDLASIIAAAGA